MKCISTILFLLFTQLLSAQVINEVCPSNQTVLEDVQEGFIDWIEIKNNSGATINLENYSISTTLTNTQEWVFPSVEILAGDFYILLSDKNKTQASSATLNLSRKGTTIYLFNDLEILIDSFVQPKVRADHSSGLIGQKQYYFEVPTPGAENSTSIGYNGYCDPPNFSKSSGLLQDPKITVSPIHPQDQIYYSKNGTNSMGGTLYLQPLLINHTTSVQAVSKRDSMLQSEEVFRTFFYNQSHSLSVVNLHIDSLAMFDSISGIYMLGPNAEEEFPFLGANFWLDVELPIKYEYFNEDLELLESLECGLKIHGGSVSTTNPLKSFRLVAHDYYDQDAFKLKYFDNKEGQYFKRLLLRNSGSDQYYTYLKDGVFHNLIHDSDLNIDGQGYRPVVVYLNGNYFGVMNLREKFDRYYAATNYFVNPDSVNLLEENNLATISGDSASFGQLLEFIENNEMSDEDNFETASQSLDMNSMADYFIYQFYLNNRDWPYNNLKLWNANSEFPKWRYMFADVDAGAKYWGDEPLDRNSLEYILGDWGDNNVHVQALKKLLQNDEYERYFINRYADLLNTIFSTEEILNYIYSNKEVIEDEMQKHWTIWWTAGWDDNFLAYDFFFSDRPEVVRNDISNVFSKEEAIELYVGIYPSSAKSIQLNTLNLSNFPFVGRYFPDNMIDLNVAPESEKSFLYWENLRTSERYYTQHLKWNVSEGDSLIAVFESDELFDLSLAPNPILEQSTLNFSLANSGFVSIIINDLTGRVVKEYEFSFLAKGSHSRELLVHDFRQGAYYLTIRQNEQQESVKFIVLD